MIHGYLVGDAEVTARLDALPTKLRDEMRVGIGRCALKLQRMVKQDKLNGQVLYPRTNRLKNSIKDVVMDEGDKVVGIVSTLVKYAPIHEYGFRGTVTVRESLRTIKQAFGRPIAARQITVKAHTRQMNMPERSFLRSALADLEASGVIRDEMAAAVKRASE